MTIKLKPEQEKFIQAQIDSGKYNSPEEVIDKMFQVFEKLQREDDEWIELTRQKVKEGIESLETGTGIDGEIVITQLRDKLRQAKDNQS